MRKHHPDSLKTQIEDLSIQSRQRENMIELLSEEDIMKVYQLEKQIDPKNHEMLISFGSEAQSKLLILSHQMLEYIQKKDIVEVGDSIKALIVKFNEVHPDDLFMKRTSFLRRWFGRQNSSIQEILSKFQKASAQIDRISVKLERNKNTLLADIAMLDQLYENNQEYYRALNMYIAAGELKYKELLEQRIPNLRKEVEETKDHLKLIELNDLIEVADLLDRRIYDLKLSREITIQSAPQIRLIQHANKTLADKIQMSIMTSIPIWKNQMAIAVALIRQNHAHKVQNNVSKATNDLVNKNINQLKGNSSGSDDGWKYNELEIAKHTQLELINSLEETLKLQEEGQGKLSKVEQEIDLSRFNG